jgi:hypothetical protein
VPKCSRKITSVRTETNGKEALSKPQISELVDNQAPSVVLSSKMGKMNLKMCTTLLLRSNGSSLECIDPSSPDLCRPNMCVLSDVQYTKERYL